LRHVRLEAERRQEARAAFLPTKWRKLIFAKGAADRRLYEIAVLATLRDRLRGSDIWVRAAGSTVPLKIIFCLPKRDGTSASARRLMLIGSWKAAPRRCTSA
jgi:hypothetical protein